MDDGELGKIFHANQQDTNSGPVRFPTCRANPKFQCPHESMRQDRQAAHCPGFLDFFASVCRLERLQNKLCAERSGLNGMEFWAMWLFALPLLLQVVSGDDTLLSPGSLAPKVSLTSARGFYRLTMQRDCNLVLYRYPLHSVVWASNTYLAGTGCHADMQRDGNLVVYDASGGVKWASHTNRNESNFELVVQDDASIAIYNVDTKTSIWISPKAAL